VHLFDPETTALRVLDSSPAIYTNLTWRRDSLDLAAFRARTDEQRDGSAEVVLTWTGIGTPQERQRTYDSANDPSFPQEMRIVSYRRPSWSDDGGALFLGIAHWDRKPPAAPRGSGGGSGSGGDEASNDKPAADEPASVDIWRWADIMVQPRQKLSATADRRRNMLGAWRLETGAFLQLGKDPVNELVTPIRRTNSALVAEWSKYAMDRTIGRPTADLFIQDVLTGARTRLKENVADRYVQVSPGGKYLLYLENDHFWTIDLTTRATVNITRNTSTSFIDTESDASSKQKPPFGVAGWTKDDQAVLLYDKFDLWQISPDGSKALKLTPGAAEQTRYRLVRLAV
jgi:hypothetical protein